MRTEKEKMLGGELYLGNDPELVAERIACRRLLQQLNQGDPGDLAARQSLLARLLGGMGENAYIEPPFFCDYGSHIYVGDRFYANFQCVILDCARIEIGDDVFFAPGVHVYAATHPLEAAERIKGPELARPVSIGSRVWMGGGSIVLPGVRIGEDTTIGAGSVVTRDVPAGVLAAGNPCRVIRKL
ncbi:MAG TPA: maltose acetyltransferase [Myxococcales bacterium]|jgi:maltose O-acetyltransferase|nr:maltose acetyltransferase [Myxococcales bacterium]